MSYRYKTTPLTHIEKCLLDAAVMAEFMGDRGLRFRVGLAWLRMEPGQVDSIDELMNQPYAVVVTACNDAVTLAVRLMESERNGTQEESSLTADDLEKLARIKW